MCLPDLGSGDLCLPVTIELSLGGVLGVTASDWCLTTFPAPAYPDRLGTNLQLLITCPGATINTALKMFVVSWETDNSSELLGKLIWLVF